jgi:hypothetical protein
LGKELSKGVAVLEKEKLPIVSQEEQERSRR